jgi:hypothetical protein
LDWKQLHEIQARVARLTTEEKLDLIDRFAANLRRHQFTNRSAWERQMAATASAPAIREELDVAGA